MLDNRISDARGWSWSGAAVLFDMDGTLVDSGGSVLRAWRWLAGELGLPFDTIEPYVHGIPAGEVLLTVASSLPPSRRAELVEELLARQAEDVDDIQPVPGAWSALDALPTGRWAVVTSADRRLALARLRAADLPLPRHLITAELTPVGKPAPEPFLLAAARIGVPPQRCLVVEDSAAGVRAGNAADCRVLGVLTTAAELAGVDHAVPDLSGVEFVADRLGVTVAT